MHGLPRPRYAYRVAATLRSLRAISDGKKPGDDQKGSRVPASPLMMPAARLRYLLTGSSATLRFSASFDDVLQTLTARHTRDSPVGRFCALRVAMMPTI